MTKGRDIAAESIGDLLEVARVQQRNGMLRAEYSQDGRLEEGEIYLAAGQPVYARAGRLVGADALNYLLGWRNIYFAFVTDVPQPPMNIYSPMFRQSSVTTHLTSQTRSLAQLPITGNLKWSRSESRREPVVPARGSTPGVENLVPRKNGPERDIFSLGLTRRQRLVFFLIDGLRPVGELARMTNKTVQEIEVVVGELQEQGFIDL